MAKIKLVVSATIEETFSDFIISRKTKGLAEKTLQSYQSQFQAVAKHMDVKMDIAMLQKADLDAMIISMRDASLSPNSINSYTRTLKSFFSWCNEQGITRLNIPLYKAEETVKETYSDAELAALLKKPDIRKATFAEYSLSNTEKQILERVFNSLVTSYGDDAAPIIDTILSGFISSK